MFFIFTILFLRYSSVSFVLDVCSPMFAFFGIIFEKGESFSDGIVEFIVDHVVVVVGAVCSSTGSEAREGRDAC